MTRRPPYRTATIRDVAYRAIDGTLFRQDVKGYWWRTTMPADASSDELRALEALLD